MEESPFNLAYEMKAMILVEIELLSMESNSI